MTPRGETPGMDHFAKAEGKAAVSRARIVATAAPLFAERGYDGASIREIAQAAGMTTASLYYHFSGKEDLFVAVHASAMDAVASAVARATEGLDDPWARLEAAVAAHCAALMQRGTAAVLVHMMFGGGLNVRDELVRQRDDYERVFRAFIEAAPMRAGIDRKIVALQMLGSLNFMAFWFRPGGPLAPDEIARRMIANLREGVAPARQPLEKPGPGKAPARRAATKRDRRQA